MIKQLLTIMFYDPDKGWVEDTLPEPKSSGTKETEDEENKDTGDPAQVNYI